MLIFFLLNWKVLVLFYGGVRMCCDDGVCNNSTMSHECIFRHIIYDFFHFQYIYIYVFFHYNCFSFYGLNLGLNLGLLACISPDPNHCCLFMALKLGPCAETFAIFESTFRFDFHLVANHILEYGINTKNQDRWNLTTHKSTLILFSESPLWG